MADVLKYCLMLLQVTSCIAGPSHDISFFLKDLAKYYVPTSLTVVHDGHKEQNFEKDLCSTSTIFCLGYTEEEVTPIAGLINEFIDDSVVVFMRSINISLLGSLMPTIFKRGKDIFFPLSEGKNVARLQVDNKVVFYDQTNAGGRVLLFEKYSLQSELTFTHSVGAWSNDNGLNLTEESRWERRGNLHGKQLRIAVLKWPPFFDYTVNQDGHAVDAKGFLVDILQQLGKNVNFTTVMMPPKDGQWGSKTDKGEYTGLVGDLVYRRADIAPSGLYVVKWREEVIDFAMPVLEDLQTLIARASSGRVVDFTVYLEIFMPQAWVMVGISFALMSVIFFAMRFINKRNQANIIHNILSSLATSAMHLIQKPGDLSSVTNISSRVILIIFALHSYVLFTYYSCNLTAAMTSTAPNAGVSSFEDAKRHGYQVLVIDGSSHAERVKDKGLDLVMLEPSSGTNFPELIANEMSKKPRILNFGSSLSFVGRRDIYPLQIKESLRQMVAFALQKDSEYKELFNHNMHKLNEAGILDNLAQKYLPNQRSLQADIEAVSLGYDNVLFPSLIMLIGIAFSILISCIEKARRMMGMSVGVFKSKTVWVKQGIV